MNKQTISIVNADYVKDYIVKLSFNDGTSKVIDFGTFLLKHNHPQFNSYKEISRFKTFRIENGNIVWGKNWDLIFPVYDLYQGKIIN